MQNYSNKLTDKIKLKAVSWSSVLHCMGKKKLHYTIVASELCRSFLRSTAEVSRVFTLNEKTSLQRQVQLLVPALKLPAAP